MKRKIQLMLLKKYTFFLVIVVLVVFFSSCCSKTIQVTTYAGNGTAGNTNGIGTSAKFNQPMDVAVDKKGNVYVADHNNDLIRLINASQSVSLFYDWGARPSGGPIKITKLDTNGKGEVFVLDHENLSIRKVVGTTSTTVTGSRRDDEYYKNYQSVDGAPDSASFYMLIDITLDSRDQNLKVIDKILTDYTVRNIILSSRITSTPAYNYSTVGSHGGKISITTDGAGNVYLAAGNLIIKVNPAGIATLYAGDATSGYTDGPRLNARFNNITSIDADRKGNIVISDNGNHRVRMLSQSGAVTTIAGNGSAGFADGPGNLAQFNNLQGIVLYKCKIYVADQGNHRVRKISIPMP
jgi:hypothetical protein